MELSLSHSPGKSAPVYSPGGPSQIIRTGFCRSTEPPTWNVQSRPLAALDICEIRSCEGSMVRAFAKAFDQRDRLHFGRRSKDRAKTPALHTKTLRDLKQTLPLPFVKSLQVCTSGQKGRMLLPFSRNIKSGPPESYEESPLCSLQQYAGVLIKRSCGR